ncbi:hypothetical protein B566_EDAN007005 [Ephemera danica]|nr:hypothetical protein B566_EDAN007005 [Ephemera danica]
MSEIESDAESMNKTTSAPGMTYLSPFSMCGRSDHRTASESNLSSSGYSSMASPGPSRCGSSNPLCASEPEEILTPSASPITPPIPPPRKLSPLIRTPAIQENQLDSNDEGFGTDHLEDLSGKLQLPSIVVQPVEGGGLSPVSSRSESPLSDKTCGLDRFSPLFYNHKPEMLPFTDSDGLYDCPSSEVSAPARKQATGNRKKERRRSNASVVSSRGGLGGLLEVPAHQVHRSARKPSPKRRAARLAPPSSSSSSESLSSFR